MSFGNRDKLTAEKEEISALMKRFSSLFYRMNDLVKMSEGMLLL